MRRWARIAAAALALAAAGCAGGDEDQQAAQRRRRSRRRARRSSPSASSTSPLELRGGRWHGSPQDRRPGCGLPDASAAAWQIDISHCDRPGGEAPPGSIG